MALLILFAPGAPREDYFEGLNELDQMSEEGRIRFFVSHDNIYL